MTRIAINGLGRIGHAAFKQIIEDGALELAAVNDLVPAEELAYLLKHDSVYGRYGRDDGQSCVAQNEKNWDKLPWRNLAVDIVLECTGVFHPRSGPQASRPGRHQVRHPLRAAQGRRHSHRRPRVNTADRGASIISCASCTTNCITP